MPRKYSADDKEFNLVESTHEAKKAKVKTDSECTNEIRGIASVKENSEIFNESNSIESSSLVQLKKLSVVVADTGEINAIAKYHPQDATTNPSLIYKASILSEYDQVVLDAIQYARDHAVVKNIESNEFKSSMVLELAMDRLAVNFGSAMTKLVPGYVSTEVDARLSFNTEATVNRARRIIKMYEELGVDKNRILIKIAATYEGIQAGEILEKEGIHCNLTLIFSLVQAAACAEANITLISPFVGRILDWYKAKTGATYSPESDPGVLSVTEIYQYMRQFNYKTIVMGASFRNVDEILELAGCDRLTIAPSLLSELEASTRLVSRKLMHSPSIVLDKVETDEASFRFILNENAMATEKLSEGIRQFSADLRKLEEIVLNKLHSNTTAQTIV